MYKNALPADEYAYPGNEYSTGEDCSIRRRERKKKKTLRSGALLAAAAAAVIIGVAAVPAAETPEPAPAPPAAVETVSLPATGTVTITFHNETFDENWEGLVVKTETFSLPGFTGCEIPQPVPADGYVFAGWVLYGQKADGEEVCYPVEGEISPYDIMQIGPGEDGNITVDVYCAWRQVEESSGSELLLDANGGTISAGRHLIFGPMASESRYFIDLMFDKPVREGYVFTGWYRTADCSGEPVHVLSDAEFYALKEEAGRNIVDFETPAPITLYAGWEKQA